MKTIENRSCDYCGDAISSDRNMNSRYCCNECYYENKKSRASEKNRQKNQERELFSNDRIIDTLYKNIDKNQVISAKELIDRNFNWSIFTGLIEVEGIKVKKLQYYGYTLFTNQTVNLWKL